MKFNIGDEVIYSGNSIGRYFNPRRLGMRGTVTGVRCAAVEVTIQNGTEISTIPVNIEHVKPTQPKFATAWLDQDELTFTGNTFFTQADADNFANSEVAANADTEMVVVQMVSKHSSSVKVTSEKL